MAVEVFRSVQEAEQKAELVIQEAQHQAREIAKDSQAECAALEREAAQGQRALYQRLMEEKRQATQASIDANLHTQQDATARAIADAQAKLDTAANAILERVLKHGNR